MTSHSTPEEPRTLVIGDVHGKYDRLRELLIQEGIINEDGERINTDVEVVQLGDLGDFRKNYTGDISCYQAVQKGWIDLVLWGNHDRAIKDQGHEFSGYRKPPEEIKHLFKLMEISGKLRFAHAIHGYLVTHAGLHPHFEELKVPKGFDKTNPYDVADWINQCPSRFENLDRFVNAIPTGRGGMSPYGGVLWRDFSEPLCNAFPQVFGHSSSQCVRLAGNGTSWCVDTSKHGRLGAIWLPDLTIAMVDDA